MAFIGARKQEEDKEKDKNLQKQTPAKNTQQPAANPVQQTASAQTQQKKKPIVKPGQELQKFQLSKSPYQQNVAVPKQPQKWYKGDQPTTSEIWGQIYRINQQDPQKAQSIATGFMQAQQQQGTQWWNPYARPTNQAVDILQSYGIDTNELTDEWYAKNTDWQKNLKYGNSTNTPQSPGKKATPEQIVAYNLYQYRRSDKQTKKAQEEAAALRQEIAYKANDPNHNYTDDEIIGSIDWNKYKTLASANEGKSQGNLTEFNSAINFTDDDMRGWIWAARNGIEEDDNIYNMAMSALGEGKQWEENPGLSAKLDKKGTDYSPFQAGMTLDPEVGLYFGKYSFDRKTIDELWQTIDENDETAVKMLRKADAAVTLRETAQEELDQLNEFVRRQIESNRNPEDIKKKIETKMTNGVYPTLAKMDESIEKPWGGIVELGSAIDYSRNSLYASIDEKCAGRDGRKNGGEVQNDITKDAAAVAPVVPEDVDSSVPQQTTPVLTDADIETGKEKDRGRQEASSVADDYMAENEQTVMAKTGSSFFPGTRQYFQGIVDNFVDAFGDITAGAAAVAEKASGICNQAFFESTLENSYDISVYDNYKTQLKEDQEKIAEYEQKYGSVEQYQEALAEKFSPEKVFVLDDWHNAVLQYDEETNEYKVAEITGEIDSLEDYQSLNAQADRLAQQNSAKAKAAMESMKRYESYSDEEKADIQDYKNRVVRAAKAQEYLDENAQDYAEKTALMNERTESLASVMQAREWLGMDNDAMYGMMDMLTFMGQYYDQPRLPSSAKTELQQFDEMYMNAATPEQRKAFVEESEKKIRDEIDGIRMSIEQAENAGYKIPDNLRQNMQYRLEDLAYRYQSFEYYKVLTDVSAEERDKAIEAGKAFEKKYGDYMESWEAYFGDDQPDDTFTTLHNRDKYQFTDVATYNEKDENGNLVKKSMDIITDDDDAIYYYLLGKKVLEEGSEFDKLWDKKDWTAEETEQTKNLLLDIFSDSNEFVDHMDNDDYGVWRSRTSDYIGTSAQGMVDESFLMGAAANVVATIATPVESIASALYILDRKINNKRINPDASARDISVFKENTRAATQKSIKDTFGEGTLLEKLASLGYEIYSNRGDSLMNSMVFGPIFGFSGKFGQMLSEFAGASPMGATAALNAAAQAVENGATTEQAWLIAGVTFLSETVTEAVTYSNIREAFGTTKELSKESLRSFFTEWLTKNGWEEAAGESLNDILENAGEQWAQKYEKDPEGYMSSHQEAVDRYKSEGYTEDEAEELALKDEVGSVLHTAFVSFLSAGTDVFVKAGKAAANTANYIRIDTKLKQKTGHGESMWQNALNEWRKAKGYAVNEASTETAMDKVVAGEQAVNEQTGEGTTAQTETSDNEKRVRNNEKKQEALDRGAKKGKKKGNTDQQQAAADVMAIERAKGTDDSTQSAAMASALTTKTKSGTDFRAETAAAFIGKIFGQNGATTVQNILTTAAKMGRNLSAVKQAIKNAALGDGAATKLVQSDLFKAARPEERVNLLLQVSQADSTDGNVQNNINVKVSDFRKTQKIAALMDQGHFDQAKADRAAAEKAAETAQRQKDTLESQRNSEAQAAENVAKTGEQVTNDPTPDNVEQNHKAVEEHKSQTIVTEQMEQAVQKAEQDKQAAEEKADKSARDAMVTARETASQEVAQEDQQIAQAEAEQEQTEAQARQQEEQEAAARQAEEDQRTGKTQEEADNEAIDAWAKKTGMDEETVARLKDRQQQKRLGKVKLNGRLSDAESYLALGALSRKLGVRIDLSDDLGIADGKYDPKTNTIYLNAKKAASGEMRLGSALVQVALHEITHSLEATKHYKAYRDIVIGNLFGYGDNFNAEMYNQEIQKKIDLYKLKADKNLTPEEAEQEIVADYAKKYLNSKETIERFMDAGMGGRMRNLLHNINQALKNFFSKMSGEDREIAEQLRKAERAFQKALNEKAKTDVHPTKESLSVPQFAQSLNLQFDENELAVYKYVYDEDGNKMKDENGNYLKGEQVTEVTPDMINNTPVGLLIDKALSGKNKKGEDNQAAAKKMFADLMSLVLKYRDSNLVWEIAGSTLDSPFSALKANSDTQYLDTVDFGTICAKTQAIINVMSKFMKDRAERNKTLSPENKKYGLTRSEVMELYKMTHEAGLSVPCPVCYVFSRWLGVPSLLGKMSKFQDQFVVLNEDGKTVNTAETEKKAQEYLKDLPNKEAVDEKEEALNKELARLEKDRQKIEAQLVDEKKPLTPNARKKAEANRDAILERMTKIDNELESIDSFNWVTQALCKQNEDGTYSLDPEFEYTPDEILFDMNKTGEFAKYKKNWTYRTTRGSQMGKAILPYGGEQIGDIINGTTRVLGKLNPFLEQDEESAYKAIVDARKRAVRQNLVGGQRLQSTSDYRPEWGLDYVMAFLELQAMESSAQMYTKVAEAVDFFANVGADVNLSIMGAGSGYHIATQEEIEQAKTDKELRSRMGTLDGQTYVMDFSDVTGMEYNTAKGKSKKYNNVQMILVGMNDIHARLAMANEDIDFIIPWHSSGNSKSTIQQLVASVGEQLDDSSDFSFTQSDKKLTRKERDENGKLRPVDNRSDEQKTAWEARLKILTGKADQLTEAETTAVFGNETTKRNEFLYNLYQRFYGKNEDGSWIDPECGGVVMLTAQAKQIFPYEYWDTNSTRDNADDNGHRFVDYCWSLGVVPRFSGKQLTKGSGKNRRIVGERSNFAGAIFNEQGDIIGYDPNKMAKGYWKLLIDRKMYENDTTDEKGNITERGKYRKQQKINVTDASVGYLSNEVNENGKRIVKYTDENGEEHESMIANSTSAKYGTNYSAKEQQAVDRANTEIDNAFDLHSEPVESEVPDQGMPTAEDDQSRLDIGSPTDEELDDMLRQAGLLTQEDIDAYNEMTSRPQEGKSVKWSQTEGPAQRQFGGEEGMLQESELDQAAINYAMSRNAYFPDTNEGQIRRAINWIKKNGSKKNDDGSFTQTSDGYYESLEKVTGKSFDYRSADGQARMIAVMAMAAVKNDVAAQAQLADAFNRQGTDLGRSLQSRKIFKMMTPEGRIASIQKMMQNAQDELNAKGIRTNLKFSDWVYRAAAAAESDADFRQVQAAAANELAQQIPASWKDKLNTIRMLSMLANPRTHIRNVIGNLMFEPAVGLKNKLGAIVEAMTVEKGQRTKTLRLVLDKDIREFARQDARDNKALLTGEAKYNEATMIKQNQAPLGKFVKALSDFNSNTLEGEDWFFLKGHYRRALGGWMQANGYTVEQVQNDPALLEKGRAYAISEAQKATYRDFNKLAQQLNDVSRKGGGLGFIVDAALPFKKTPANILRRGLEYSPVGIVKSLTSDAYHMKQYLDYQNGKLNALPEKAMSPTQVIDHLCSGLSGTAVAALGFLLAGTGAVSCGLDDDDDKFDKAKGGQEYALKFNLFGQDVTFTVDWAAPMAMPFFVGAAIREMAEKEGNVDIDEMLNAFGSISEPVFNLSMLDGVNTLFKTSQNDNTNQITQILAKIGTNYVSSYVPSALGAVARTIDDKQRKSFVESGKGSGVMGTIRYALEQMQNKIPFYNQQNIADRDIWGNEKTSGLVERILENFILPGYVNEYKDDPIINEMARLYDSTGDSAMIPKEDPSDKTITVKKEKRVLTDKQWDQYKATRNQTAFKELTELMNDPNYQNSSDAVQVQMIKDIWSHATEVGKNAVFPDYELKKTNVSTIAKDSKIAGLNDELIKALNAEDYDAYDTMVEAIREEFEDEKDADSTIKTKIGDTYRDQWKDAYRNNDTVKMDEIEELLEYTGLDFNIYGKNGWMEQEDKKMENNRDSGMSQVRYSASNGVSDVGYSKYYEGMDDYRGNIDINNRPVVYNDDGSISTEESFSTNIDGKEVLLPTIINGRRASEDEAIDHYFETGEHLGMFDTVEEAEEYAQRLHERQDWYYHR